MEDLTLKRLTAIVGHYGSGKTEVTINLAKTFCKRYKLLVMDMDTVNPYFRTVDARDHFDELKIKLVAPRYANTNVDVPALPQDVNIAFDDKSYTVLMDVGGDDDGAVVLSTYRGRIKQEDYDMFAVVNERRLQTNTVEKSLIYLQAIEKASGLKVTGIINNTNLGNLTDINLLENSVEYMEELSRKCGLPVVATAVKRELLTDAAHFDSFVLPMDIHIKRVWEE